MGFGLAVILNSKVVVDVLIIIDNAALTVDRSVTSVLCVYFLTAKKLNLCWKQILHLKQNTTCS